MALLLLLVSFVVELCREMVEVFTSLTSIISYK